MVGSVDVGPDGDGVVGSDVDGVVGSVGDGLVGPVGVGVVVPNGEELVELAVAGDGSDVGVGVAGAIVTDVRVAWLVTSEAVDVTGGTVHVVTLTTF